MSVQEWIEGFCRLMGSISSKEIDKCPSRCFGLRAKGGVRGSRTGRFRCRE